MSILRINHFFEWNQRAIRSNETAAFGLGATYVDGIAGRMTVAPFLGESLMGLVFM